MQTIKIEQLFWSSYIAILCNVLLYAQKLTYQVKQDVYIVIVLQKWTLHNVHRCFWNCA